MGKWVFDLLELGGDGAGGEIFVRWVWQCCFIIHRLHLIQQLSGEYILISCMLLASLVQDRQKNDLRYRMQLHSIDENIGQNAQTWSFKRREMLVVIYPLIPPQKRPRHIADGGLECFIGTPSLPSEQ